MATNEGRFEHIVRDAERERTGGGAARRFGVDRLVEAQTRLDRILRPHAQLLVSGS